MKLRYFIILTIILALIMIPFSIYFITPFIGSVIQYIAFVRSGMHDVLLWYPPLILMVFIVLGRFVRFFPQLSLFKLFGRKPIAIDADLEERIEAALKRHRMSLSLRDYFGQLYLTSLGYEQYSRRLLDDELLKAPREVRNLLLPGKMKKLKESTIVEFINLLEKDVI
jgi:hypothetical protein